MAEVELQAVVADVLLHDHVMGCRVEHDFRIRRPFTKDLLRCPDAQRVWCVCVKPCAVLNVLLAISLRRTTHKSQMHTDGVTSFHRNIETLRPRFDGFPDHLRCCSGRQRCENQLVSKWCRVVRPDQLIQSDPMFRVGFEF